MIPYGRQNINKHDIDSVIEVLTSDFLTQGPVVPKFEENVAQYVGAKYSVAVNSATSALHIACLALGIGDGDIVWTTPISFVASANCALYCGATVDFVDIDPVSYNLGIEQLEHKLKISQQQNRLPKAIVVVHLCGEPCDMERINQLSHLYNFKIIEDASHAIGGKYKDCFIGSCEYSDITIFSFHPVKIITTAEGGMALTNNRGIYEKMKLLRSHGITRDETQMTHQSEGDWYYQQIELGFNYRMTELQAALGLSQMLRLNDFVSQRHVLAERYDELLKDLPIQLPQRNRDNYSGLHLYVIRIPEGKVQKSRKEIFAVLRSNGIGVNVHYIPIHTQPYYIKLGFKQGDFPNAEKFYNEAITIPLYSHMTIEQQDFIVENIKEFFINPSSLISDRNQLQ